MDIELVPISELMPNPENYRQHPPDQIAHLVASLEQYGWARNVVVSADSIILAGHGIVQAAQQAGRTEVPIHRLPWPATDPRCRKFMVLENEVSHLAENDDRQLTELLRELSQDPVGLPGTGYDDDMLAALVLVTRPASEIPTVDRAKEWADAGMPEYDPQDHPMATATEVIVRFRNPIDRRTFAEVLGIQLSDNTRSTWYPQVESEPPRNFRGVADDETA